MRSRVAQSTRTVLAAAAALLAALAPGAGGAAGAPDLAYTVVASHPHDPEAFTQGLLMHQGQLIESTGLRGRSTLRVVEPASGKVLRLLRMPRAVFAEGLALAGERFYQLTWTSGRGFVYDARTLSPLGEFRYSGEGWGLTFDGTHLIMSDGSAELRIVRPEGFREVARVKVRDGDAPVDLLNELEYVEGAVFANVWNRERVARIDPRSGRVTGWLDFSGLLGPLRSARTDVLNGIAWEPERRRFWITGKRWPRIFVVQVEGY